MMDTLSITERSAYVDRPSLAVAPRENEIRKMGSRTASCFVEDGVQEESHSALAS